MRGYGGTSAPADAASYICYTLAADMLALLQHIGAPTVRSFFRPFSCDCSACVHFPHFSFSNPSTASSQAALVGHDHGAATGWTLSLLHPEIFTSTFTSNLPRSHLMLYPFTSNFTSNSKVLVCFYGSAFERVLVNAVYCGMSVPYSMRRAEGP